PGQHGDVGRCPAGGELGLDEGDGGRQRFFDGLVRPTLHPVVGGPDGLGDPATVVLQETVDGGDDPLRAAVVHLEGVVAGPGEPTVEVDEPGRVGAVVAVDRLV